MRFGVEAVSMDPKTGELFEISTQNTDEFMELVRDNKIDPTNIFIECSVGPIIINDGCDVDGVSIVRGSSQMRDIISIIHSMEQSGFISDLEIAMENIQ